MIAYARIKTSYIGEMIQNNKKIIFTIPSAAIAETVISCSSTTTDKATDFDIELTKVNNSSIKIPVHSCVAVICNMKEYHEVDDHYLYFSFCSILILIGKIELQSSYRITYFFKD